MLKSVAYSACVLLVLAAPATLRANDPPEFVLEWGSEGSGPGQFLNPRGIAVDLDGLVYVADTGNDRVHKYTSSGVFILEWGITGTGDSEFMIPVDVSVDSDGNVWVMDNYLYGDRLQKFDPDGNHLLTVNVDEDRSSGIGSGNFTYYAAYPGYQIMAHDLDGTAVTSWSTSNAIGTDIAVGVDETVYIAEWYYSWFSHRTWISRFTSDGTPISVRETTDISTCFGGLASSENHEIYATAQENKIVKLDDSGLLVVEWGEPGTGEGQFDGPVGIAVDHMEQIYVADTQNHRIQKFGYFGDAIECVGFEPPLDRGPVTPSPNRVLPFKAQLFDAAGYPITDADILSPPRIEVTSDPGVPGSPVPPEEELPPSAATEGNEFEFNPSTGRWVYHLRISDFSSSGTYTLTMESGDTEEYVVYPTCAATFVID